MRRVFLPIATALTGALVGPLAATFPVGLFFPFVGAMAVFVGFPLAAFAGFLFGIGFSLLPSAKLQGFYEQGRAKRLAKVAAFGATCGVLCYLLFLALMNIVEANGSNSPDRWFAPADDAVVFLPLLAYGGALSSLVLWPLVHFVLAPKHRVQAGGDKVPP